ncbi:MULTISPECIES: hypothetical protein [unclassified Aureimonas]|uniref:hypothetical protein n=1 Tax=unclassified Aureimonas TaxID=2615206 RepID=UPI0006FE9C07|nr:MULTISPECIES: hypothetical protein [unclassified Aureimonas]KQT66108.1 hypothetical protein ASG62_20060 [Aureimonas sp. Leaf427]KQT81028.1 hypothetical protein ASG54_06190 [Aureimonas sp. Leaf460]
MSEGKDNVASLKGSRRLADAVRAAKISAAQRSDVVVDIREADRARLEIFAEEMQPVVDEMPAGDDLFDFTISGGPQPRYWVDGTAHVSMARDRRTYRFVRETRIGRKMLAESTYPKEIADRVVAYVAERIVERDKAFAETDGFGRAGREDALAESGAASPFREFDALRLGAGVRLKLPTIFAYAISILVIGMFLGVSAFIGITSIFGLAPS